MWSCPEVLPVGFDTSRVDDLATFERWRRFAEHDGTAGGAGVILARHEPVVEDVFLAEEVVAKKHDGVSGRFFEADGTFCA